MNSHAVEQDGRGPTVGETNVQAADDSRTIVERAVSHTGVRTHRKFCVMLHVLTNRRVKGLSRRRADSIRTRSHDQRGSDVRLSYDDEVGERANLAREWVVLQARGESRMETVSQSIAPRRAVDLIRDDTNSVRPLVIVFSCPAHGAAFAGSKRSTRH